VKTQPTEQERVFVSCSPVRGFIPRIHKEHKKLNIKKRNNPVNKCASELNKPFSEEVQMAHKYMKNVQHL
jgi:hypothetical protein